MRLLHVVGARPNFMKIAPVLRAVDAQASAQGLDVEQLLVHTGQHYDERMSEVFFQDLGLPRPDIFLGIGSGSHAEQTARVLTALEKVVLEHRPQVVVVAGDVNSTLAAALVAAKAVIPIAHVESGLRSFDMTMPEEVNRIVTDRLSALCLTPSPDGDENLLREGVEPARIERIGNVMIDSLQRALPASDRLAPSVLGPLGVSEKNYALATLHRPANVDDPEVLSRLVSALVDVSRDIPVVFPVHPRTRARIEETGLAAAIDGAPELRLVGPLGYLEFQALTSRARLVLTDSGGIQEETTALGVPCLTLRENTERPITVTEGTNTLVGRDPERIAPAMRRILDGEGKTGRTPELWDGRAGERAAAALLSRFGR